MKLVVMQPYFFPYVGYFQLIHAADRFVVYDDVNYIKNGWINRNRLLLDGAPHYFTIPLAGASPFAPIHETRIDSSDRWRRKMLETFRVAYKRAPHAAEAVTLLERALGTGEGGIGDVARVSIEITLEHFGLQRGLVRSSRTYGNAGLKGQERVIDICRREGATTYINAPGGRALYDEGAFRDAGIALRFLEVRLRPYAQSGGPFVPGLSVLDAVAWCGREELTRILADYTLSRAGDHASGQSSS